MIKQKLKLFQWPLVQARVEPSKKLNIFSFSNSKDNENKKEDTYEKICREERERMNRLGEESREKYKKQTSFTRVTFLVFAGVINIYFLKKLYAFVVHANDPYSEKGGK